MQIFFYHLGRMKVIADILVFGIFFKGVFPFDCIEILLLGLKHTVQIDQALFLLFQFGKLLTDDFQLRLVILTFDGFTLNLQLFDFTGNLIQLFRNGIHLHA